jgi:hypothetical protein
MRWQCFFGHDWSDWAAMPADPALDHTGPLPDGYALVATVRQYRNCLDCGVLQLRKVSA